MNKRLRKIGIAGVLPVAMLALLTFGSDLQAYSSQLRSAVVRIINIPQVAQRMIWTNGGISSKELITLIQTLEPETYRMLRTYAAEYEEQSFLELVIKDELGEEVFPLDTPTATKYFWGKKPDIRAIVDEVAFSERMIAKMDWEQGHGGLSNARIIQELERLYPAVYSLYVQSSDASGAKNDDWLRRIITGRIHSDEGKAKLGHIFFTARKIDMYGNPIHVYYKGVEPDVEFHLLKAIAKDENLADAMHSDEGATMDSIVAAVREHSSKLYWFHVLTNKGSLIYRGFTPPPLVGDLPYDRKAREHGLRSLLGKTMNNINSRDMQITRGKNSDGETTYRFLGLSTELILHLH